MINIPYVELTPLRRLALLMLAMGSEAPLDWVEELRGDDRQAIFLEMQLLEPFYQSRRWTGLFACDPLLQHRREGRSQSWREQVTRVDPGQHVRRLAALEGAWLRNQLSVLVAAADPRPARAPQSLSPRQKAAVLLMMLPPSLSAEIFARLGVEEVQTVTLEIAQLPVLESEDKERVLSEFLDLPDLPDVSQRPLGRLLQGLDDPQLLQLLEAEEPPTIAALLRSLEPSRRVTVLNALSPELRQKVRRQLDTVRTERARELARQDLPGFTGRLRERWLK